MAFTGKAKKGSNVELIGIVTYWYQNMWNVSHYNIYKIHLNPLWGK